MSDAPIVVGGERYLALEVVARCYEVQVEVLREAWALGLFGAGVRSGGRIAIASLHLDRVATVVRLHVHHGVDLAGVALFLGAPREQG